MTDVGDGNDDDGAGEDGGKLVHVNFGAPRAPASDLRSEESRDKLSTFRTLIGRGMVMVTLDSRKDGVSVPLRFANDAQLALNFSHRFGVADFAYDDVGVRCTLTFQGQPFFCDVPWSAVYGMRSQVDGQTLLWPESLPDELLAALPPAAKDQLDEMREEKRREQGISARPKPKTLELRDDDGGADEPPPEGPPEPSGGGKGKLRLIK